MLPDICLMECYAVLFLIASERCKLSVISAPVLAFGLIGKHIEFALEPVII